MTWTIFRQHRLRRGLEFSELRLGVFWGLTLLDSTLHPGLSFLPVVLLDVSQIGISGLSIATS